MGKLTRWREQFKQKTKQGGADFKPSYNDRAHVTYAEASKFAESLKITRKKIAVLRTATESVLRQSERALTTPLPRVYDFDPEQNRPAPTTEQTLAVAGDAIGDQSGSGILAETGDGLKVGQLTPIAATLSRRMEHEVLHPMDQWLKLHADYKLKLNTLERRRLDYDADRRSIAKLEQKRSKAAEKNVAVKAEVTTSLQAKEHTALAKKNAFDSYEAEIFEELQALVADAGALHTFLEAAMKLEASALTSAIGSQPTTIFDGTETEGMGGEYGEEPEDMTAYPDAPRGSLGMHDSMPEAPTSQLPNYARKENPSSIPSPAPHTPQRANGNRSGVSSGPQAIPAV